jgi:hypothetical protein
MARAKKPKTEAAEPKRGCGRPTAYKPEFAEQARKLCLLGATDMEVADFFGVTFRTVTHWKNKHSTFVQALKTGHAASDDRVERSLFHRAIGYSYDAEKVFPPKGNDTKPVIVKYREHVPPDTTACIFWLKNRRREQWRDVHKHEHGRPGDFDGMNTNELRAFIRSEAEALGVGNTPLAIAGGEGEASPGGGIN